MLITMVIVIFVMYDEFESLFDLQSMVQLSQYCFDFGQKKCLLLAILRDIIVTTIANAIIGGGVLFLLDFSANVIVLDFKYVRSEPTDVEYLF